MNVDQQPLMHPAHTHIWELLPWYLNNTLDSDERDEVRHHLGECLVCNQEIRRLERLEAAVAEPLAEQACNLAFARLSRQIRRADASPSWPQRLLDMLHNVFEPVPLLAGAALLVVSSVLVATIVVSGNRDPRSGEQPFQTLGHKPNTSSTVSHPLVRIVLREDPQDAGLDAWLSRHAAELVDGPSAIGVLTVRISTGSRAFDNVIADIRADEETLFVEPVNRIGTRPDRHR